MSHLEVKQFAVKYNPPTLVIQYRNNTNGKTFLKNIRLIGTLITDAEKLTDKIIQDNYDLLGPRNVPRTQVLDLMKLIIAGQSSQKPAAVPVQLPVQQSEKQSTAKEYGDLNKASDVSTFLTSIQQHSVTFCIVLFTAHSELWVILRAI